MIPIFNNFVDGRDKVWSSVMCSFLGFSFIIISHVSLLGGDSYPPDGHLLPIN